MTRKQAIIQAIQALSKIEGHEEAIALLQDIHDEMPLIHWSDKSIRDTVEQFIVDNGRMPTVSDFRKKGMPPHPVIKNKYGITLAEWLKINYPQPEKNTEEEMTDITNDFIYTYNTILPTSSKDFDVRRPNGVKCWATVAQHNGCTNWTSLLKKLSLPSYSRCGHSRDRVAISVSVFHDLFDNEDRFESKTRGRKLQ